MEENKEVLGTLFDSINYYTISDLEKFINEMTNDHALYSLIQAVNAAHKRGVYSLEEVEVVSKSIRLLTSPPEKKPDYENPPDTEITQS